MSEEEKKAIEYLQKYVIPYINKNGLLEFLVNETVLNLIDRLQKELEQEKEKNEELDKKFRYAVPDDIIKELYVGKDKLKELIYPTPENYIPIEVQTSNMYKRIEDLLKEN